MQLPCPPHGLGSKVPSLGATRAYPHLCLDIELFDSRKYMTGTPADLVDQVHPNVLGHQEILHALTDIY